MDAENKASTPREPARDLHLKQREKEGIRNLLAVPG